MVVGISVMVFFFGMLSEVVGLVVDSVILMLMLVWVVRFSVVVRVRVSCLKCFMGLFFWGYWIRVGWCSWIVLRLLKNRLLIRVVSFLCDRLLLGCS